MERRAPLFLWAEAVATACYTLNRSLAKPTEMHLTAIKRIFRYLKAFADADYAGCYMGARYMGLWYPKDSGFKLKAFADADYAGCHDTRRSTSGSAQFLGYYRIPRSFHG
ncbi:retrovirus-related pol polyprotein from transposon TNT 1-94 [Tanacetum coccineum]